MNRATPFFTAPHGKLERMCRQTAKLFTAIPLDEGRRACLRQFGGTMPEQLPVPDQSIEQIESARKRSLR